MNIYYKIFFSNENSIIEKNYHKINYLYDGRTFEEL